MRILIAPDSFKECMAAKDVASIIAGALSERCPEWEIVCSPLSDGGEGCAVILTDALGGDFVPVQVTGPMGESISARYGRVGDTAFMDVASAVGLSLVPVNLRDPMAATSGGVGELILSAVNVGCRKVVLGLGGSATCDGGAGMLEVGGLREAIEGVEILALCDVENPFIGPEGAARVFGPQKGATPDMVELLEERMQGMAARILDETGMDVAAMPGAGAAGGLGGALTAFLGAKLVSGADAVMDLVGFDSLLEGVDYVITGEGKSDRQTLCGKLPQAVLGRSGAVPVVLMSGRIENKDDLKAAGFAALLEVTPAGMPHEEALSPDIARRNLIDAANRFIALAGR